VTSDTITFMLVLAQVAGIFIGFGALISVSKQSGATQREAKTLAMLVYIGIMIMVGSLLPVLLDRYGIVAQWSLRIGAIALLMMAWLAILKTASGVVDEFKQSPLNTGFFWLQEIVFQVPLILIVIGVYANFAEAFMLTALVVAAFEAAQLLVGIVFSRESAVDE